MNEVMYQQLEGLLPNFGLPLGITLVILFVIILWSFVWKGIALWKAARRSSLLWFVILLLTNTLGILEILYVYVFSEMKFGEKRGNIAKRKK
jgi:uncharacterized membrane protein